MYIPTVPFPSSPPFPSLSPAIIIVTVVAIAAVVSSLGWYHRWGVTIAGLPWCRGVGGVHEVFVGASFSGAPGASRWDVITMSMSNDHFLVMVKSEEMGMPRKMAGDGDYYIQLIFFGSLNHPIPTQAFDSLE